MGNVFVTRRGSGGSSGSPLETLGFKNVPSGDWKIVTGTLNQTAKNANIIPLCVRQTWSNSGRRGNQSDGTSISTSSSFSGGSASGTGSVSKALMGASLSVSISGYANNLFLPYLQELDLTKTQTAYPTGTFTVWLAKQ